MKKRNGTKILLVIAALLAIVGIFCMFAAAFYEGDSDTGGSVRGNVFKIMFGVETKNGQPGYSVVVPLVIGFCLLLLAAILPFFAIPAKKKGTNIICLLEAALGIGTGVLFFMAPSFYVSANPYWFDQHTIGETGGATLGPGCICVIVFAFLVAAAAILALLVSNKKKERN